MTLESTPSAPGTLPTFEADTLEAHVHAWRMVSEEVEERLWMLGAIAASLTRRYGERAIPEFAEKVHYSARRIYELAATYTAWQYRDRAHDLSFKHHTVAARAEDPDGAIEEAIEERLSARELARRLKDAEERAAGVEKVETLECPACGGSGRVPVD